MSDPIKFSGFPAGINNIQPDYALKPDELRNSNNVDLFDNGKVRRRKGSLQKISLAGAHSIWSDPKNPLPDVAYYVAGTTLYSLRISSGALVSAAIATGLTQGRNVCYLYLNGDVFWSNGVISGRIRNGVNMDWGVETPAALPPLSVSAAGTLSPGRYQVLLTYRNSSGEEGGSDVAQSIVLTSTGSIVLSGIPVALSTDATQVCIYVTSSDGDMLHKIATVARGTTSYTINSVAGAGTAIKTRLLSPMPAGDRIAHLNGVIYVASGPYIYHSEPMRYGLCNLNENFYAFPQEVAEILDVTDGLYVCADKTYFLSNPGTADVAQRVIFSFGAVKGTGTYLLNSTDVAWFSGRGQVIASAGGQAKAVTEGNYMPGTMSMGAVLVREKNGLKQIINTVQQSDVSALEYTGE